MNTYVYKKVIALCALVISVSIFFPQHVYADYVSCQVDLSIDPPGSYTVKADWAASEAFGGPNYDIYLYFDGDGGIVGKFAYDYYNVSGIETYTYTTSGIKTVRIKSGPGCDEKYTINIPDTPSNPLGTICVQVYGGPAAAHFSLTKPNGTTDLYDAPAFCTDDMAGTWTIGQLTSLNGYNGPTLMQPGTNQTVPIGSSQNVNDTGWIGWDITYAPWKYRCSGAGSCIRDDVNGNTTDPACNNSCSAPANVPTATISANPQTVPYGGSSTVSWSSTDATSCTVSPVNWMGTSGSRSTGSLSADATYTLNCTGAGGVASNAITITVLPPKAAVNGVCGSANKVYPSSATSYGTDTYCSAGSPNASPAFPSPGNSSQWICLGQNGGTNSSQCTARVAQAPGAMYSLTVTKMGNGSVKSNDSLINCGTTCSQNYAKNSLVVLTATPASSYWKFNGWGGDCAVYGIGTSCAVTVDAAKNVMATFTLRLFNYKEF